MTDAGSGGGNLFVFNRSNQQVQSFQGFNGGAAWFHVDNSTKRVGIGATSPSETLTISGTTQDVARIKTSAVNAKLYFEASATTSNNYIQCTGNELLAVVNGGERLRINSSGNVGIGSNAPVEKLDIANGILRVSNNATPSNENDNAAYFGKIDGNAIVSHSTAVAFRVNSTERVRIDSSGNLLVKISSARTNYRFNATSISPLFQLESTGGNTSFGITRNGNTGNAGTIYLAKSRGTTNGSNTIVQQDDRLGSLSFNGADGTDLVTAARIEGQVDGTPGTNDMPGRLVFSTTADGASNPTERMRIDSGGKVGIGTSNPVEKLDVNGTVKCKNVREIVFTITWSSSFVLKPVNGGTQFVVLGGNSTPTQSGWTNGESITLHIDDGASRTITWTTLGVVWTGGTAPTLATTGDTVVQLWKANGVIYGALVGEVA